MSSVFNASVIANVERLLGLSRERFDLDFGRQRWQRLRELDPFSPLLIPPPGAPPGTVSLEACYLLAGRKFGFYSYQTALEGITTWAIPLLVLVGNMNFAGFRQYKVWNPLSIAAHVLGNPVDALWGLLTKLDLERRIECRCREEFGNIVPKEDIWIFRTTLIALDGFGFSEGFEGHLKMLKEVAKSDDHEQVMQACRRAAFDLAAYRVNNTGRTLLAILGFCAAVASKLLLANSSSIPPHLPHTIALRAIMYWLGPMVILSAKAGGYPSEWTSVGILRDLEDRLDRPRYFDLQPLTPWNGGNYTWRPQKDISHRISGRKDARSWFLLSLSVASVTGAWATSFVISFRTPTRGVGARGVAQLSFLAWWLSVGFATGMVEHYNRTNQNLKTAEDYKRRNQTLKTRWIIMSCINMVGAVGILTILLGSFSGTWARSHPTSSNILLSVAC